MATSSPICDICMTDGATKSASLWCSECEEAICINCEKQHSRMKLTKNHQTIPIDDYQKLPGSVAEIKKECKVHNKKLDFYCLIHHEPCCVSCVSEKHGTCQTVKPLTEVVNGVKSSAAFEDLEDRAKDISELIDNLIKKKQDNKASFAFQKNGIISEVQKIRKAINIHLDNLQTDLFNKLDNEEKKQINNIDSFIEKISEMRKNVDQIVNDLKDIKQHASDFQAFIGIHEWNKKIEVQEKDWMSLHTNLIMDTFGIHVKLSPILLNLEKDVKEIGKLEVKSSFSKKILLKKEKQGQIFVPIPNTVDNIKLTKSRSFHTPDGACSNTIITGIDMFNDGRIVLAEPLNNRLVIMNQEGEYITTIQLEDRCYDVAVIDKDTVATTLFVKKKFIIVDVKSSKAQSTIPTKDQCYGIICTGKQLVVNLSNLSSAIQFFDLSGNTLSTLSTAGISFHCSVLNDKLYYSTQNSDAVYSTDMNGEVRWKFDCQKSDFPTGITNDAFGNIFVICKDSHQLLVVGQDGKESRVLLTKEDALQKPRVIHYNCKTNILIVCNLSGQCFLYKVTN